MRSVRLIAAAACVALGSFAACVDSGDGGPPPSSSVPTIDASFPDTGSIAPPDSGPAPQPEAGADAGACTVQASLASRGADAGGTVVADDFTCPDGIDLDASTATLDFTGTGFARAPQSRALGSAGDGGEGPFTSDGGVADDAGVSVLAAGSHEYSSFDLEAAKVFVNGDLTLLVSGPFQLGNAAGQGGLLAVQGNLTIVASGPVTICGEIDAAGDVTIHQPTNAGITFGCAAPNDAGPPIAGFLYSGETRPSSAQSPALTAVSPGDVDLGTRGPILFPNGGIYSGTFGAGAAARSGNVTLRAYGDVTLGSAPRTGSYLYVAGAPCVATGDGGTCAQYGATGDMKVLSEGTITFDWESYLYAGSTSHGSAGGNVSLRGAAGVRLDHGAYLYAGSTGALDLLSQGRVTLDNGAYGYAGNDVGASHDVTVRGSDVTLDHGANLYAEGAGGSVAIAATGNVTLDHGAYLYASDAQCKPGGNVELRARGDVAITNGAYSYAGSSDPGAACAAVAGGSVTLLAGGAITAPVPDGGTPPVNAGNGTPAGTITQTAGAAVAIGVLDAELEPPVRVVSRPMASASPGLLFGATGATDPAGFAGAQVLVSPSGGAAAFAPIGDVVGAPLAAGWRWQVQLPPRMFDPSGVDGVVVRVK